jgi:hypothetical protein
LLGGKGVTPSPDCVLDIQREIGLPIPVRGQPELRKVVLDTVRILRVAAVGIKRLIERMIENGTGNIVPAVTRHTYLLKSAACGRLVDSAHLGARSESKPDIYAG